MAKDLTIIEKFDAGKIINQDKGKVLTVNSISSISYFNSGRYCFKISFVMDGEFIFNETYGFYGAGEDRYECEVVSDLFNLLEPFLEVDETGEYPKIMFTYDDVVRALVGRNVRATAQIYKIHGNEHVKINMHPIME
jgi:hypothetical protein